MSMMAEMGVMNGLSNMDFDSPKLTQLQMLLSARFANNKTNTDPQIWHNLPVSNLLEDYLYWVTSALSLLKYIIIPLMHLSFLYVRLLTKLLYMNIQNILSTNIILHTIWLLTNELISQSEKCDSDHHGNTGLSMFPTILKQLAQ